MTEDCWWTAGLSLVELPKFTRLSPTRNAVEADEALKTWAEWGGFETLLSLDERLQFIGLTRGDLETALSSDMAATSATPEWVDLVERAAACDVDGTNRASDLFAGIVTEAVEAAHRNVSATRGGMAADDVCHRVVDLMRPALEQRLGVQVTPVLVLLVNIARLRQELQGSTPEERWNYFVAHACRASALKNVAREYPVLGRDLSTIARQWVAATTELALRLENDINDLAILTPTGVAPGELVSIHPNVGDTHSGGRAVALLEFAAGGIIVYKPRSVRPEAMYCELVKWYNSNSDLPELRAGSVLERRGYGYMEYVPHDGTDAAGLTDFYMRAGQIVALHHALGSTDFHAENIVACGSHPVLVDCETLLTSSERKVDGEAAKKPYSEVLLRSVIYAGMVPMAYSADEAPIGGDITGLGGRGGQQSVERRPVLIGANTDEVRFETRDLSSVEVANRPHSDGSPAAAPDYVDDVIRGFRHAYGIISDDYQHGTGLRSFLDRCLDVDFRVVIRPTAGYGLLLEAARHPDYMSSGIRRARLFDSTFRHRQGRETSPQLILAEIRALEQCEVPLFTSRGDSDVMRTADGEELPDRLTASPVASAHARLARLSDNDRLHQEWLIRTTFGALRANMADEPVFPKQALPTDPEPVNTADLKSEFFAIVDGLLDASRDVDGFLLWLTCESSDGKDWALRTCGLDLYEGLPGICLVLAIADVHGHPTAGGYVRRLLKSIEQQTTPVPPALSVGGFSGLGGVVYMYGALARLYEDSSLAVHARRLAFAANARVTSDALFDLVGGASGFGAALHSIRGHLSKEERREYHSNVVDCLIAGSQRTDTGSVFWPAVVETFTGQGLTGLAHGAAGIAMSMWRLRDLGRDHRIDETVKRAVEYERERFDADESNWPDLRKVGGVTQPQWLSLWCHGAPGVGLARADMVEHGFHDGVVQAEIRAASVAVERAWGSNHSLCHGDIGNEIALGEMRRTLGTDVHPESHRAPALSSLIAGGRICGHPVGIDSPGLMCGVAGMAYALAYALDRNVPRVLTLSEAAS